MTNLVAAPPSEFKKITHNGDIIMGPKLVILMAHGQSAIFSDMYIASKAECLHALRTVRILIMWGSFLICT